MVQSGLLGLFLLGLMVTTSLQSGEGGKCKDLMPTKKCIKIMEAGKCNNTKIATKCMKTCDICEEEPKKSNQFRFHTVNSRFKKDLKFQIHLNKAFFWMTGF